MSTDTTLLDVARAEYEQIQKKIDSIGEFKFRVRGWSLTLQTAVLAGLFTGKIPDGASTTVIYVALTLALVMVLGTIFIFHGLEQEQEFISKGLRDRAFILEKYIDSSVNPHDEWPARRLEAIKKQAREKLLTSPRIAATMQQAARTSYWDKIRHMFRLKLNSLYLIQYGLTIIGFIALGYLHLSRQRPEPEKNQSTTVINQVSVDRSVNVGIHKTKVVPVRVDVSKPKQEEEIQ
ncbi:MAG: hypothetical protein JWM32_914 [Verrucomicrobia bacterium]|nr:hypothetical protein [Verrucomicrobiota bacterium]